MSSKDNNYYVDMIIVSSLVSIITTQVHLLFSKTIIIFHKLFVIFFVCFEDIILKLFLGSKVQCFVLTDFNPIYAIIEDDCIKKKHKTNRLFRSYLAIKNYITIFNDPEKNKDQDTTKSNRNKFNPYASLNKTIVKECSVKYCPVCSSDPISLTYPCNQYDGIVGTTPYTKEHALINKLENRFLIKHKDVNIIVTKYSCIQHMNIMCLMVYSKQTIDYAETIQDYLDTQENYRDKMVYSYEMYDQGKYIKRNGAKKIWYLFNHMQFEDLTSLVEKVSKNTNTVLTPLCAEFKHQDNSITFDVTCPLNSNIDANNLIMSKPLWITDYATNARLQKRLNIGYRNYYNDKFSFTHEHRYHTLMFALNGNTVTTIVTNSGFGMVVSRIGSQVTEGDLTNTLLQMVTINNQNSKDTELSIYKLEDTESMNWLQGNLRKRTLDSIYLPQELKETIKNNIINFMSSEKAYESLGIPYKLGLLFFGPPGTGKTSLVRALANDYNMSIYLLDLNNSGINDDNIAEILNSLPDSNKYKILLFEDVDAAFIDKEAMKNGTKTVTDLAVISGVSSLKRNKSKSNIRDNSNNTDSDNDSDSDSDEDYDFDDNEPNNDNNNKKKKHTNLDKKVTSEKHLTYSGLLNAFDGVSSNQNKVIMIMTTNHKEKLGSALIRPGRIDYVYCIDYCTREQIVDMVRNLLSILTTDYMLYYDTINKDIEILADNIMSQCNKLNEADKVKKVGVTPAQVQAFVMKYSKQLELLFSSYYELFED